MRPSFPRYNSAIKIGMATKNTQTRYTSTKAPPPLAPVRYGNLHIFPKPTAAATAAKMKTGRDEKVLAAFMIMPLYSLDDFLNPPTP